MPGREREAVKPSQFDPERWAVPDWAMGPDDFVVQVRRKQVVTRLRRRPPTGLVLPAGIRPSAWLPEARRRLVAEDRYEICWHFEPWDPDYGPYDAAMEAYAVAAREFRAYRNLPDPPLYELKRRAEALRPDAGGRFGFRWQLTRRKVAEWTEEHPHVIGDWFDVDHVVPLMADGPHAMANLQLLCKKCHLDKSRTERGAWKGTSRKSARGELKKARA